MLNACIITLFPEIFPGALNYSLLGQALNKKLWALNTINMRQFAGNKTGRVDDEPFGGGLGMVIKAEVIMQALEFAIKKKFLDQTSLVIHPSPRGILFTPEIAKQFSQTKKLVFIAGRYEAIDQRLFDYYQQQYAPQEILEISIGDYVLSGGELPIMVMLDAALRYLPGVLGKMASTEHESHEPISPNILSDGVTELQTNALLKDTTTIKLLEHHHYTRPAVWRGLKVPEILLTGDHKKIKAWQMETALQVTLNRRPDMLPNMSQPTKLLNHNLKGAKKLLG